MKNEIIDWLLSRNPKKSNFGDLYRIILMLPFFFLIIFPFAVALLFRSDFRHDLFKK